MKKQTQPPRLGTWLLRRIYDDYLFDDIAGDLEELYRNRIHSKGKFLADIHYLLDAALSVRNIDLKKKSSQNHIPMIKNAFLISYRSLMKRKSYSLINIGGLSFSIAFVFLLWFYIDDQKSYDIHFANADRIYRINMECNMNGKLDIYANVPQPVAHTLQKDYQEIEAVVRIAGFGQHTGDLKFEGKSFTSHQAFIAEKNLFHFFDHEFIYGNPDKALEAPNSVVISESMAYKIFNTTNVLDKTLFFDESKLVKITGVIKDSDANTHLPMDVVVSWATYGWDLDWWYGGHVTSYLMLNDKNDIQSLQSKMPGFYQKYMKKTFESFNGTGRVFFQPIKEIHLSDELVWEPYPHGSKMNVTILSIVSILLIAFACINYINLSTARAIERASEVSIRKMLGSSLIFLWTQFMSEAFLLSVMAGACALLIAALLLPQFNQLTGLSINLFTLLNSQNILRLVLLSVGIGAVAGVIPAFHLSSLHSIRYLKGKLSNSHQSELFRNGLVAIQYFVAALLISGIWIVYQQTIFIKTKDTGFNRENLINITVPQHSETDQQVYAYLNDLRKQSGITAVSRAYQSLIREADAFTPTLQNPDGTKFQMGCDIVYADFDFLNTIGASLLMGRNFNRQNPTDGETAILINETAMKKFGWDKNPLEGKFVGFAPREPADMNIIGVVKDFHLGASYQTIRPQIFFLNEAGGSLYVRTNRSVFESIDLLRKTWKKFLPGYEFEFSFVDESLNSIYKKEERFLNLLTAFCFITLLITSLGIIGLISFTAQLKRKEIAIRKVLGSSLNSIINMLSKKFIGLLLLANLLAVPITYYLTQIWLSNFSSRIEIDAWPFIVSGMIMLLFTVLSLLYHTLHAARANPVEALKYE